MHPVPVGTAFNATKLIAKQHCGNTQITKQNYLLSPYDEQFIAILHNDNNRS